MTKPADAVTSCGPLTTIPFMEGIMAARTLPDAGLLRQLLDYNPQTGSLVHRVRPREMFASKRAWSTWNARYAGLPATSPKAGYLRVIIFNRHYKAHRVAYKIHFSIEPPPELDHINGDGLDNRISNLRPASSRQNKLNQRLRSDSTTSVKGVSPIGRKFRATARVGGKQLHLGRFSTISEAAAARRTAEIEYYGEFARQG